MFVCEAKVHPHVPEERAELFEAVNGGSLEREYQELLTALVRSVKPTTVLETGAYVGVSTECIARALERNGFGKLVSLEVDAEIVNVARDNVRKSGLAGIATVINDSSLHYLSVCEEKYELAFFDSDLPIRCKEFELCLQRGLLTSGDYAVFHDTSRRRIEDDKGLIFWEEFGRLQDALDLSVIEFPLSRGVLLVQIQGDLREI